MQSSRPHFRQSAISNTFGFLSPLPPDTVSMMHCLFSPPPRNEIELINHGGGLKLKDAAAPSDISEAEYGESGTTFDLLTLEIVLHFAADFDKNSVPQDIIVRRIMSQMFTLQANELLHLVI